MNLSPAEARAAWSAALRSGEYAQGQLQLRRGDEFCCLGVACDLYQRLEGVGQWRHDDDGDVGFAPVDDEAEYHLLPWEVQEWLGVGENAACDVSVETLTRLTGPDVTALVTELSPEDGPVTLAGLNDNGATFAQIADVIDAVDWERQADADQDQFLPFPSSAVPY